MASSTYTLTYWDDSTSGSTTFYTILGGVIKYGTGTSQSKSVCTYEITAKGNGNVISTSKVTAKSTPMLCPNADTTQRYLCAYYVNSQGSEGDLVSWGYKEAQPIQPTTKVVAYLVITTANSTSSCIQPGAAILYCLEILRDLDNGTIYVDFPYEMQNTQFGILVNPNKLDLGSYMVEYTDWYEILTIDENNLSYVNSVTLETTSNDDLLIIYIDASNTPFQIDGTLVFTYQDSHGSAAYQCEIRFN